MRRQYESENTREAYGLSTAIDCSNDPRIVRQEQKVETELGWILSRHGVMPNGARMTPRNIDYTIDLQQAVEATRAAKRAYAMMPAEMRREVRDWRDLLAGLDNGSIEIKYGEAPAQPAGVPPA